MAGYDDPRQPGNLTINASEAGAAGGTDAHAPIVIDAHGQAAIDIPAGQWFYRAAFDRAGPDLTVTGENGESVVIRGYFQLEDAPDMTLENGSLFKGAWAEKLSGSAAPNQVAQVGGGPLAEAIGRVTTAEGEVQAVRADGSTVSLAAGDPVFQGDELVTSGSGAVGIEFEDGSTFSLADEGRMILDEMIYDPETQSGALGATILTGVFSIVSGDIAKTEPDAMVVETPVGSIGIRGTALTGQFLGEGQENQITLVPEGDQIGEIVITNDAGTITLNQSGATVLLTGWNDAPDEVVFLSLDQIREAFSDIFRHNAGAPPGTTANQDDGRGDETLDDLFDFDADLISNDIAAFLESQFDLLSTLIDPALVELLRVEPVEGEEDDENELRLEFGEELRAEAPPEAGLILEAVDAASAAAMTAGAAETAAAVAMTGFNVSDLQSSLGERVVEIESLLRAPLEAFAATGAVAATASSLANAGLVLLRDAGSGNIPDAQTVSEFRQAVGLDADLDGGAEGTDLVTAANNFSLMVDAVIAASRAALDAAVAAVNAQPGGASDDALVAAAKGAILGAYDDAVASELTARGATFTFDQIDSLIGDVATHISGIVSASQDGGGAASDADAVLQLAAAAAAAARETAEFAIAVLESDTVQNFESNTHSATASAQEARDAQAQAADLARDLDVGGLDPTVVPIYNAARAAVTQGDNAVAQGLGATLAASDATDARNAVIDGSAIGDFQRLTAISDGVVEAEAAAAAGRIDLTSSQDGVSFGLTVATSNGGSNPDNAIAAASSNEAASNSFTISGTPEAGDEYEVTLTRTYNVAQVSVVTLSGTPEVGDVYEVTINGVTVNHTVTAADETIADIRARLIEQINQDAGIGGVATAGTTSNPGDLILTGEVPGQTFEVSVSTTGVGGPDANADNEITAETSVTPEFSDTVRVEVSEEHDTEGDGIDLDDVRDAIIEALNGDLEIGGATANAAVERGEAEAAAARAVDARAALAPLLQDRAVAEGRVEALTGGLESLTAIRDGAAGADAGVGTLSIEDGGAITYLANAQTIAGLGETPTVADTITAASFSSETGAFSSNAYNVILTSVPNGPPTVQFQLLDAETGAPTGPLLSSLTADGAQQRLKGAETARDAAATSGDAAALANAEADLAFIQNVKNLFDAAIGNETAAGTMASNLARARAELESSNEAVDNAFLDLRGHTQAANGKVSADLGADGSPVLSYELNAGVALADGQVLVDTFTIRVTDGAGGTDDVVVTATTTGGPGGSHTTTFTKADGAPVTGDNIVGLEVTAAKELLEAVEATNADAQAQAAASRAEGFLLVGTAAAEGFAEQSLDNVVADSQSAVDDLAGLAAQVETFAEAAQEVARDANPESGYVPDKFEAAEQLLKAKLSVIQAAADFAGVNFTPGEVNGVDLTDVDLASNFFQLQDDNDTIAEGSSLPGFGLFVVEQDDDNPEDVTTRDDNVAIHDGLEAQFQAALAAIRAAIGSVGDSGAAVDGSLLTTAQNTAALSYANQEQAAAAARAADVEVVRTTLEVARNTLDVVDSKVDVASAAFNLARLINPEPINPEEARAELADRINDANADQTALAATEGGVADAQAAAQQALDSLRTAQENADGVARSARDAAEAARNAAETAAAAAREQAGFADQLRILAEAAEAADRLTGPGDQPGGLVASVLADNVLTAAEMAQVLNASASIGAQGFAALAGAASEAAAAASGTAASRAAEAEQQASTAQNLASAGSPGSSGVGAGGQTASEAANAALNHAAAARVSAGEARSASINALADRGAAQAASDLQEAEDSAAEQAAEANREAAEAAEAARASAQADVDQARLDRAARETAATERTAQFADNASVFADGFSNGQYGSVSVNASNEVTYNVTSLPPAGQTDTILVSQYDSGSGTFSILEVRVEITGTSAGTANVRFFNAATYDASDPGASEITTLRAQGAEQYRLMAEREANDVDVEGARAAAELAEQAADRAAAEADAANGAALGNGVDAIVQAGRAQQAQIRAGSDAGAAEGSAAAAANANAAALAWTDGSASSDRASAARAAEEAANAAARASSLAQAASNEAREAADAAVQPAIQLAAAQAAVASRENSLIEVQAARAGADDGLDTTSAIEAVWDAAVSRAQAALVDARAARDDASAAKAAADATAQSALSRAESLATAADAAANAAADAAAQAGAGAAFEIGAQSAAQARVDVALETILEALITARTEAETQAGEAGDQAAAAADAAAQGAADVAAANAASTAASEAAAAARTALNDALSRLNSEANPSNMTVDEIITAIAGDGANNATDGLAELAAALDDLPAGAEPTPALAALQAAAQVSQATTLQSIRSILDAIDGSIKAAQSSATLASAQADLAAGDAGAAIAVARAEFDETKDWMEAAAERAEAAALEAQADHREASQRVDDLTAALAARTSAQQSANTANSALADAQTSLGAARASQQAAKTAADAAQALVDAAEAAALTALQAGPPLPAAVQAVIANPVAAGAEAARFIDGESHSALTAQNTRAQAALQAANDAVQEAEAAVTEATTAASQAGQRLLAARTALETLDGEGNPTGVDRFSPSEMQADRSAAQTAYNQARAAADTARAKFDEIGALNPAQDNLDAMRAAVTTGRESLADAQTASSQAQTAAVAAAEANADFAGDPRAVARARSDAQQAAENAEAARGAATGARSDAQQAAESAAAQRTAAEQELADTQLASSALNTSIAAQQTTEEAPQSDGGDVPVPDVQESMAAAVSSAARGISAAVTALKSINDALGTGDAAKPEVAAALSAAQAAQAVVTADGAAIGQAATAITADRNGPDTSLLDELEDAINLAAADSAAKTALEAIREGLNQIAETAAQISEADAAGLTQARASAIEQSAEQVGAGGERFANSQDRAALEAARAAEQARADALPDAEGDDLGAMNEDDATGVTYNLLSNDMRADSDPLVDASLASVGDPANGAVTMHSQVDTVTVSGAVAAGAVYRVSITVTDLSQTGEGGAPAERAVSVEYTAQAGDNAAAVRDGLAQAIASSPEFQRVATAADGSAGASLDLTAASPGQALRTAAEVRPAGVTGDGGFAANSGFTETTTAENGRVTFTPDKDFNGTETFTYTVYANGGFSSATASVRVNPVNDAPEASDDVAVTADDSTASAADSLVTIRPLSNDSDVDGDTLSLTHVNGQAIPPGGLITIPLPGGKSVTLAVNPATGEIGVRPVNGQGEQQFQDLKAGQEQAFSFNYTVSDGQGGTKDASVSVTITGTNDAPSAAAVTTFGREGGAVQGDLSLAASDMDNENGDLSFSIVGENGAASQADTANGRVSVDPATGRFTYTPNDGFSGVDSFSYRVEDPSGAAAVNTVRVYVNKAESGGEIAFKQGAETTLMVGENQTGTVDVLDMLDGEGLTITSVEYGDALRSAGLDETDGIVSITPDDTHAEVRSLGAGETLQKRVVVSVSQSGSSDDTQDAEISGSGAVRTVALSGDLELGDTFLLRVNGEPMKYVVGGTSETLTDVRNALIDLVNGNPALGEVTAAAAGDDSLRLTGVTSADAGATNAVAATRDVELTVTVTGVNDAPELSVPTAAPVTYTENGGAVAVGANITVTDPDSAEFEDGWLTVGIGGYQAGDALRFDTSGRVSVGEANFSINGLGVWVDGTFVGTLDRYTSMGGLHVSLTENATPALVQELARAVTFEAAGEAVQNGQRTIQFSLNDGDGGASETREVTVNVIGVNDAPELSAQPPEPVTYTENGDAVAVGANITVTDPDSANFGGGTLTIGIEGYQAGDSLSFDMSGGVSADSTVITVNGTPIPLDGSNVSVNGTIVGTVTRDSSAGGLTVNLTDAATPALVQQLANAVTFESFGDAVQSGQRTIQFALDDGDGGTSETREVTVDVTGVNDAPELSAPTAAPVTYTENGDAVAVGASITVTDPDSAEFEDGALTIGIGGYQAGDALGFDTSGGVSVDGSNVSVNGTLVGTFTRDGSTGGLTVNLTDAATPALVQELARAVTFETAGDAVQNGQRTIQFALDDGDGGTSETREVTVTVTGVNDAPVLSAPTAAPVPYTENGDAVAVGASITVTDPDSANFEGGALTIGIGGYQAGDALGFDTSGAVSVDGSNVSVNGTVVSVNGILVGTFTRNGSTGELTVNLTEDATPALVQELARAVTFETAGDAVQNGQRTILFTLGDGDGGTSELQEVTVTVTGVNDAPVLSAPMAAPVPFNENGDAAAVGASVTVTDPDSANFEGGALTIGIGGYQAGDSVGFDTSGGLSVDGANVSVNGTLVGTFTRDGSTGGLRVNLTDAATPALVQQLARAVTFKTVGDAVQDGQRTIQFALDDGDGGTSGTWEVTSTVNAGPDAEAVKIVARAKANTDDVPITLSAAGAEDGAPVRFTLESLPAANHGSLYQMNEDGSRGAQISESNTAVTNSSGKLIFSPSSDPTSTVDVPAFTYSSADAQGARGSSQTIELSIVSATNTGVRVVGTDGSETLLGADSRDNLFGHGGDDVLIGGGGADRLTGGAGADTFVFKNVTDSTGNKVDVISDFESGTDKIDISELLTAAGATEFTFLTPTSRQSTDQTSGPKAWFVTSGTTRRLEIDKDGDASSDAEIEFEGTSTVTGDDIITGLDGS